MPNGLLQFVNSSRKALQLSPSPQRNVYVSDITNSANGIVLAAYVADRAPLFYRKIQNIVDRLAEGYFLSAFKETLAKLPTSTSFRESHFGEIVAGIFSEEVIGLKKVYNKLSLLTSENANAYKIDLVFCDPKSDPLELVFGQVKSSPKSLSDGFPSNHDKSCYADVFNAMNEYLDKDLSFDLTAASDNLDVLEPPLRDRVRAALLPYSHTPVKYAAFVLIDRATKHDDEMSLLESRKNKKSFEVDVICVEEYRAVADEVYRFLEKLK